MGSPMVMWTSKVTIIVLSSSLWEILLSIYSMSKKSCKTFRLAFIRRRINTTFRSRALRADLLAELNGGEDAALVVQMVERVRPIVSPPTQVVAPVPHLTGEEDATPEAPVGPVDPPTQAVATPQVAPPDGHMAATAVEISDSEDELLVTPASRRSSSSDWETLCVLVIVFLIEILLLSHFVLICLFL